jgi:hypothetical protein
MNVPKHSWRRSVLLCSACLGLSAAAAGAGNKASSPAAAGGKPAATAAPAKKAPARGRDWKSIAALPDFYSGVWMEAMNVTLPLGKHNALPSLTPEYAAKAAAAAKSPNGGYGADGCAPRGVPSIMRVPYAKKFIFEPGHVYLFMEGFMQLRFVYLDGRAHPKGDDLLPTFNGHSIGHWEGDTLVIDTVGFVDSTPLVNLNTNLQPIYAGHSAKMHVVERYRLLSRNEMEVVTTVDDPIALAKPWTYATTWQREDRDLDEYECSNPLDLNSIK